ncbi:MAG TPA: hypothetical protein DD714_05980, partial [Candidatus Omnitrophica bacterium]|nr:hypothetical protein [Candidatus Omnitrophota bacterium]
MLNAVRTAFLETAKERAARGEPIRSLEDLIRHRKWLIMLSAGSSKRIPPFAALGKIFIPLPANATLLGPRKLTTTVFDELRAGLSNIAANVDEGLVVIPGDALVLYDPENVQLVRPGERGYFSELVWRGPVSVAEDHGVRHANAQGLMVRSVEKEKAPQLHAMGAVDDHGLTNISTALIYADPDATVALAKLAGLRVEPGRGLVYDKQLDLVQQPQFLGRDVSWFDDVLPALALQTDPSAYLAAHKNGDFRRWFWRAFRQEASLRYFVTSTRPLLFGDFGKTDEFMEHLNSPTMLHRVYRFPSRLNAHVATGADVSWSATVFDSVILGLRELRFVPSNDVTLWVAPDGTIVRDSQGLWTGGRVELDVVDGKPVNGWLTAPRGSWLSDRQVANVQNEQIVISPVRGSGQPGQPWLVRELAVTVLSDAVTVTIDRDHTIIASTDAPWLVNGTVDLIGRVVTPPPESMIKPSDIVAIQSETYESGSIGDRSIVSASFLDGDFKIGQNCLVLFVFDLKGALRLGDDTVLYQVPVKVAGVTKVVNMVFGAPIRDANGHLVTPADNPKDTGSQATLFRQPLVEWLKKNGVDASDFPYVWPEHLPLDQRSLWNAKLFAPGDDDFMFANWMSGTGTPRSPPSQWLAMLRSGQLLSMEDVNAMADHEAIMERRRRLRQVEALVGSTYFDGEVKAGWDRKLAEHVVLYDPQDDTRQQSAVLRLADGKQVGVGWDEEGVIVRTTNHALVPHGTVVTVDTDAAGTRTLKDATGAVLGHVVWVDDSFWRVEVTNRDGFVIRVDPRREDPTRPKISQAGDVFQPVAPGQFSLLDVKQQQYLTTKIINGRAFLVLVNNTPTIRHTILLTTDERRPQILLHRDIQDALAMVRNSRLRLWFNSLGAAASVNHFHFQGAYADELPAGLTAFPVEQAPVAHLAVEGSVRIGVLAEYPAQSMVFESDNEGELAAVAFRLVNLLQVQNIPHNPFFSRNKVIVFVRNADRLLTRLGINPAGPELAGIVTLGDRQWLGRPPSADDVRAAFAEGTIDHQGLLELFRQFQRYRVDLRPGSVEAQLLSAFQSANPSRIRAALAQKLEQGLMATLDAIEHVLNSANDADRVYHEGAVIAVGLLGTDRGWALLTRQPRAPQDDRVSPLTDPRNNVRLAAVRAFGRIRGKGAVEELLPLLNDPFWAVHREAAYVLGESRDPRATAALVLKLNQEGPNTLAMREQVARAIGKIGDVGPDHVAADSVMRWAEQSPDETLRRACVWALGQLNFGTNETLRGHALATVQARLNDPSLKVRLEAGDALPKLASEPTRETVTTWLRERLAAEQDWQVQEQIVRSLGMLAGSDSTIFATL